MRWNMGDQPHYKPAATLYYGDASLQHLMADLETLAQGFPVGAVVRLRGPDPGILEVIPAWCARHGWRILRQGDTWETELIGAPRWKVAGYCFDIQKAGDTGGRPHA